jgi:uncharacterized membrane protein
LNIGLVIVVVVVCVLARCTDIAFVFTIVAIGCGREWLRTDFFRRVGLRFVFGVVVVGIVVVVVVVVVVVIVVVIVAAAGQRRRANNKFDRTTTRQRFGAAQERIGG